MATPSELSAAAAAPSVWQPSLLRLTIIVTDSRRKRPETRPTLPLLSPRSSPDTYTSFLVSFSRSPLFPLRSRPQYAHNAQVVHRMSLLSCFF